VKLSFEQAKRFAVRHHRDENDSPLDIVTVSTNAYPAQSTKCWLWDDQSALIETAVDDGVLLTSASTW